MDEVSGAFKIALSRWVQKQLRLDYLPQILGTEWQDGYEGTCGEGTCDYSEPAMFSVFYSGENDEKHEYSVGIEGDGFVNLVKEIAELM
jgi:hypothetical protein